MAYMSKGRTFADRKSDTAALGGMMTTNDIIEQIKTYCYGKNLQ